uniref:Uncharacterized protein n=1 Tax=Parascaris univalens TaxID=6257 RepID=A0A915C1B6_PARUN
MDNVPFEFIYLCSKLSLFIGNSLRRRLPTKMCNIISEKKLFADIYLCGDRQFFCKEEYGRECKDVRKRHRSKR